MRNGQNKRMRGRNRKSHNPLTRVYESNGPDVKIRGSAVHVAEKYLQLARDAQSSGDPVAAENYFQHAEHYFRLIASAQEQFRQPQQQFYRGEGNVDMRGDLSEDDEEESAGPGGGDQQPAFGTREPQPYLPRDAQFYPPREQPNFPREQQGHSNRYGQSHQAATGSEDESNVERLPSFITGGAQPAAAQGAPQSHQGHGSNGYEGQGERFPLHRRRRRHRGPRNDMAQGGQGGGDGDDAPRGPQPGNE